MGALPGVRRAGACRPAARSPVRRAAAARIARRSALRPVAVWIDGDPERAAATKAALASGTVAPAAIVEGSLPDALAQTRAGHVMLVRAGDRPAPIAVERLGQAIALAPDAAVITCDDDRLSTDGCPRRSSLRARALAGPLAGLRRQRPAARGRARTRGVAMLDAARPAARLAPRARAGARRAGRRGATPTCPLLLCHRAPAPTTERSPRTRWPPSSPAGTPARGWSRRGGARRVRRPRCTASRASR